MEQAQLPAAVKSSLKTTLDLYQLYVHGFKYCAIACFRGKKAMNTSNAGRFRRRGKPQTICWHIAGNSPAD